MKTNNTLDEKLLAHLLGKFDPKPTARFFSKIEKAPWKSSPKINFLAFKAAAIISALIAIMLFSPIANPLIDPTSTPTISSTSESPTSIGLYQANRTPAQNPPPETTPVPPPLG